MLLNGKQTAEYLGIARTKFYALLKVDPTFPKGVALTSSQRFWDPARLDAWREARFAEVNSKGGRAA